MKSTEFLIENSIAEIQRDYKLPDEVIKLAYAIRKDCKQYLNENPEPIYNALYRGIGGHKKKYIMPNLIKKNVRLGNRDPADMPTYLHMEINQYFKDYHGAPFRNAMFCTGSDVEASGYGAEFVIFPIGNFEYIWSPKIDDLWTAYDSFTTALGVNLSSGTALYDKFVDDVVYNADWETTNLIEAISSKHEIMIRCKSYYGIKYDYAVGPIARGLEAIFQL